MSAAPDWLRTLRAGAEVPPRMPRVPLYAGAAVIGSVEPDFLVQISDATGALLAREDGGWRLQGEVTASLAQVARALHDAGLGGAWRDEQLAVCDEAGRRVGTVERAAVRPLGITTSAVHLVGAVADGRIWVQQRAWNKANDPGLWDTLMGGMVSAADTLEQALARETWEEAGLRIEALQEVALRGRVTTRRPALDGRGAGYVVEHIDWFHGIVPEALVPDNQDGEVEQFALVTPAELHAMLARGAFTTEAALILAQVLGL